MEKNSPERILADNLEGNMVEKKVMEAESPTYVKFTESLVSELTLAMELDVAKIVPEKGSKFKYDDIESWLKAVDFKDGDVPNIEASISSEKGTRVVKFKTDETRVIENPNKEATKEENLYSVALTEAKLRCLKESKINFLEDGKEVQTSVMELMKDVYPAIEPQIDDLREVMKEVEAEILKDPRERMKLDDVLDIRISRRKALTVISAVAIGAIILSACASNPSTETPGGATQPAITETAPVDATPTTEATATPEKADSEIAVEGFTGVKEEFLLNGNVEINKETGEKFYTEFLDALAKNKQNQEYMVGLLGESPDGAKLLDYLKNNDYVMPAGLNLPYRYQIGSVKLGRNPIAEEIKLDTIKGVAFGPNEWNGNTAGITDYVNGLKTYAGLWVTDSTYTSQYLGWGIDPEDNRLVLVAGAKTAAPAEEYPWTEGMSVGGGDGNFDFDRDSKVALGEWLQIVKLLETYDDSSGNVWQAAVPFGGTCDIQESSAVCDVDVEEFLGGS